MPQLIAFEPSTPNYRMTTVIDGMVYILDVRWNGRDEAWYFDLLTEDETMIRAGIKIVLGARLGGRSVNPDFPDGVFIAADLSGAGSDAGLDDLGVRVMVYFYTAEEANALG